jgi:hypothetical protein
MYQTILNTLEAAKASPEAGVEDTPEKESEKIPAPLAA